MKKSSYLAWFLIFVAAALLGGLAGADNNPRWILLISLCFFASVGGLVVLYLFNLEPARVRRQGEMRPVIVQLKVPEPAPGSQFINGFWCDADGKSYYSGNKPHRCQWSEGLQCAGTPHGCGELDGCLKQRGFSVKGRCGWGEKK